LLVMLKTTPSHASVRMHAIAVMIPATPATSAMFPRQIPS